MNLRRGSPARSRADASAAPSQAAIDDGGKAGIYVRADRGERRRIERRDALGEGVAGHLFVGRRARAELEEERA